VTADCKLLLFKNNSNGLIWAGRQRCLCKFGLRRHSCTCLALLHPKRRKYQVTLTRRRLCKTL